jgi:hypothetical protein
LTELAALISAPENAATAGQATPSSEISDTEFLLWKGVESSSSASDYRAYLDKYPNGTFATLATRRIEQITQQEAKKSTGLIGSNWVGKINWESGSTPKVGDIALEFVDESTCEEFEAYDAVINRAATCTYKKIGTAIYVDLPDLPSVNPVCGGDRKIALVLAVQEDEINGTRGEDSPLCADDVRRVSLRRSQE